MNSEFLKNLKTAVSEEKITLVNGLTVCVCEMPEFNGVYALYGTNFGSVTRKFTLGDTLYNLPAGTAHFLEHKMFENEEGIDAFSLYAKTGASANAFTSFDKTCYLFSAADNIDESLDILLSFVSKPYFTKETIEKEQGIIGQEIKMYDDSPEWRLMFAMLENMYGVCPVKEDIAGTVDSIAEITPEILYAAADAFYRPENMVLSVAGSVTLKQVLAACERAKLPVYTRPVKRIIEQEPREIIKKQSALEMAVAQPIMGVAYKEIPLTSKNRVKGEIICDILGEILTGDTSSLYRSLYDDGLINNGFSCEYLAGDGYLAVMFSGESSNPDEVERRLKAEIEKIKKNGVNEREFACIKNVLFGEIISDLEKTESVATNMLSAAMQGTTRFDEVKTLAELTAADINEALGYMLCDEYSTSVRILPIK